MNCATSFRRCSARFSRSRIRSTRNCTCSAWRSRRGPSASAAAPSTASTLEFRAGTASRVPDPAALVVFRVLQESLDNVIAHAGASRVTVSLRETDGGIDLEVADDGVGFDPEAAIRGTAVGLVAIRERLRTPAARARSTRGPARAPGSLARVPIRASSSCPQAALSQPELCSFRLWAEYFLRTQIRSSRQRTFRLKAETHMDPKIAVVARVRAPCSSSPTGSQPSTLFVLHRFEREQAGQRRVVADFHRRVGLPVLRPSAVEEVPRVRVKRVVLFDAAARIDVDVHLDRLAACRRRHRRRGRPRAAAVRRPARPRRRAAAGAAAPCTLPAVAGGGGRHRLLRLSARRAAAPNPCG